MLILTKRFEKALVFACQAHADQTRKGTSIPYISHLLGVCGIVLECGGNEDEAMAALLHDAVEDRGGKRMLGRIRRRFGRPVAEIVEGCSDSFVEDPSQKPPWKERKEQYLEHLRKASASIRLVSAADKLHNARAILQDYRKLGEGLWERFHAGKQEQLWYYRSLVASLRALGTNRVLVDELDRVVRELERLVRRGKTGHKAQSRQKCPRLYRRS